MSHEGFWQSVPTESIIHVIEDSFLASTQVVELYDVTYTGLVVIGEDTSICVFSLPNVKRTILTSLSLNDKSIWLSLPFLDKNGVQFELNAIDFFFLPSRLGKH